MLRVVTSAFWPMSSPAVGVFGDESTACILSLSEVSELMDLIQGDLLSVSSTPPPVCLVFSCGGIRDWSGHTVRSCFGRHANGAMLTCSLSHVYFHSVCWSTCLSLPLSHPQIQYATHSISCEVCVQCLPGNYATDCSETHKTLLTMSGSVLTSVRPSKSLSWYN